MQKLLLIVGPTAIGKTSLGIRLAKDLQTKIISGDSMQIYQEVAIGTAKPSKQEQAEIRHYLVDERSIFAEFGVKDFVSSASSAISEIAGEGKVPLAVGGTGFYLSALVNGLQLGEAEHYDSPVEPKWEEYLARHGPEKLWQELAELDPVAVEQIPVQNTRRVLRALSVITRTNKKFSEQQNELVPQFDAKFIGLNTDRAVLYERINQRVDLMMEAGLLEEAQFVYENHEKMFQAKQAIGYKEFFPYFAGESDLETAVAKLKQASRKYAKRQLTYFNNKLPVIWYDPLTDGAYYSKIKNEIGEWLND